MLIFLVWLSYCKDNKREHYKINFMRISACKCGVLVLTETEQAWLYCFVAQGSSGILLCWIRTGMKEPPETVAAFLEALLNNAREALLSRRETKK